MAEKIAALLDCFDELLDKIKVEEEKQKKIIEILDKIEKPYGLVLFKIYIEGKTLVRVADEMKYSYRDICRKHGIALNKFEEI